MMRFLGISVIIVSVGDAFIHQSSPQTIPVAKSFPFASPACQVRWRQQLSPIVTLSPSFSLSGSLPFLLPSSWELFSLPVDDKDNDNDDSKDKDKTDNDDSSSSNSDNRSSFVTKRDLHYMNLALNHARVGFGNTFPNPAVGCVIVRSSGSVLGEGSINTDDESEGNDGAKNDGEGDNNDNDDNDSVSNEDEIIGSGFHPMAGSPHAEIFALFEACGHLDSGINAARVVVEAGKVSPSSSMTLLLERVQYLTDEYKSPGGPERLFSRPSLVLKDSDGSMDAIGVMDNTTTTAYVTLEPCCHVGKGKSTPPCTSSLLLYGVDRVVIGTRDPNPKVDGGGVERLRKGNDDGDDNIGRHRIVVNVLGATPTAMIGKEKAATEACRELIGSFAKRVGRLSSKDSIVAEMTGARRRSLRRLAGRLVRDGNLVEFEWPRDRSLSLEQQQTQQSTLDHRWLERIDDSLWKSEIVLIRLNKCDSVKKKADTKAMGERIAQALDGGTSVVRVLGRTVLLYRPGEPPIVDVDAIV